MVMPNLAGEAAFEAAELMRRAVDAAVAADWPHIPFRASFGIADLDTDVASASLWVASADAALYGARQGRRNLVST